MATKRKTPAKPRSSTSRRKTTGAAGRFLKTLALSAAVAFSAASWALHPHLPHPSIERALAALDVSTPIAGAPVGQPQAAPSGAYIQTAFPQCREFFPGARPPAVPAMPALRELCFTDFAVLYSGQRRTPVLVVERLDREKLLAAQRMKRTDHFYEEARLPSSERVRLSDYRGSGYDRGHMAPAGDMWSEEGMAQSFSLANMVPQSPAHNRGAWSKTEQATRKYVMRAQGDVYVVTGPVYDGAAQTIGEGRVAVPNHIFKLVYDASNGKSWVHWQPNSADAKLGPPISYEEFGRRTGLRVLGQ